ncbi:MAG: basic amino acid ABC transporter substrate-binding protein [Hyphomicrobiales bacterium]|nr:MAG: basic amino acid ABC transporter substrate-binding protein [Hyphomicrobiales bacterium]
MFLKMGLKLITASLMMFGLTAQAAELPDLSGRTLKAVTENGYFPLNFSDPKTGTGIGWEYDAVNEIASRLNLRVEWSLSNWDAMIESVRTGQYDIGMDGITINDERKQVIDFSDTYLTQKIFLLVRADETNFNDSASFVAYEKGLVGAQPGTTGFYTAVYDMLDGDESNPRIKLLDTFASLSQALKIGDVDVILTDETGGKGIIAAFPGSFKMVGDALKSEDFGFILTKGSDLLAPINAALASMRADGTLADIDKKWFADYKMNQ